MVIVRFLVLMSLLTVACLGYLAQEMAIIRVNYQLQGQEKRITHLLDQNKILRYNNAVLKSPVYLEKKVLARQKNFELPYTWQLVRMENPQPKLASNQNIFAKARNLVLNLFTLGAEAQANVAKGQYTSRRKQ
jgi:predicted membrane metal-binding protein